MNTCRRILAAMILLVIATGCLSIRPVPTPVPASRANATPLVGQSPTIPSEAKSPTKPQENRQIKILLDDFKSQPYQGDSVYFFNRLEGDRGAINNSNLAWGSGQVTTTVSSGNSWGGVWMSLNHPIREGLPINFSAILPSQILPAYQSQITGITVVIARGTPNRAFRIELKDKDDLRWKNEVILSGGRQVVNVDLPTLGNVNQLVWVLDRASAGDYVLLESISFTATTPITDTAIAAFVWSYGMLMSNWNPTTGLVRDKAKDASGEFDAIQSTGSFAAATAVAEQLGVISRPDATRIVDKISRTLLVDVPRFHGLLPHWVKASAGKITIVPDTEWSSVDTVIALVGLIAAQSGLGASTSDAEQMLQAIEWNRLVTPGGISHGYTYAGDLIPYAWDVFGGESWLVGLAYAGATGQIAPMAYSSSPSANGSGFIDELAWLFVLPPSKPDYWGTDWTAYRTMAADRQWSLNRVLNSKSCLVQLGLFGLSAGEVPWPASVSKQKIYQAFGVGGRFSPANDGSALFGSPVVVPHYSAMIASLKPQEAITMWDWLMASGLFTPLTNIESIVFSANSNCDGSTVLWNDLKGSWNLALQALGWGRYLAEQRNQVPILWQATLANPFLRKGYLLLTPNASFETPTSKPNSAAVPWTMTRECENPDESSVGQTMDRSNALGSKAHGQFGTAVGSMWPAKPGYVKYNNISTPQLDRGYLKLRYSKYSPSTVPILVYLDSEASPRATIHPLDQGDWNKFIWTEAIPFGNVASGVHSIKFSTEGQQYGVADLDAFTLTGDAPSSTPTPTARSTNTASAVSLPKTTTPIAKDDLLVWYDFEDNFLAGGRVTDRSGNGQNAQVYGTVAVTKGISGGQAILLSGNGYLQASSNPVAGRKLVSFSLWFKTDHPESNYKLASAAWWQGGPGSGWIIATHIPEFWSDDTKSLYFPNLTNQDNHFPAGEWAHEVVTYDGQRIKEYTNGKLINDWPTTGAAIGRGQSMVVGAWPPFTAYNFQGSLDEFQVFARSLTLQEVQMMYNQRR